MEISTDDFIFSCPENRRYWVVRAAGGTYVRNFHAGSIAAIGHIDHLNLPESTDPQEFDYKRLKQRLEAKEERSSASVTSHINQIKSFVAEIQHGDFIVTLDSNELSIGQVIGDAYLSRTPVLHGTAPYILEMNYQLRRDVNWGPILKRRDIPSGMNDSLHAHQTVFNIDSYWAAVHHLVFPYFRRGNNFYFTLNIRQRDDISNYSLSQLFMLLSEFEAISRAESASELDADFEYYFSKFRAEHKLNLSTKAEFMSPGDIWGSVSLASPAMVSLAIGYIMLFGGSTPLFKSDGIIDKKLRHKIFEMFTKRLQHHDSKSVKENLKLEHPKNDTSALTTKPTRRTRKKVKSDAQ